MIKLIKTIVHKSIRSFGFDVVSVGKLEQELDRRELARALAKAEAYRKLSSERVNTQGKTSSGQLRWVLRDQLELEGGKLLKDAKVLLDIGCAFRPQQYIDAQTHICCEPFPEYMDRLMADTKNDPKFVYLNCDLTHAMELIPPNSVDSVFMLDVIEHIDKEIGKAALTQLKKIARSQVVIFTPYGFMEQVPDDEKVDQWGMGGTEWQRHRSGWMAEDFPLGEGWSIVACEDFFVDDAYGRPLETPIGAFWAIWNRA